jgi:DNA glycosylase AlkZ-like
MVSVVQGMCGAHAQIASSVPLALAARVARLQKARVDDALGSGRLVKTWAMRGTLHVFAAEDLPLYCAAGRSRDQYDNPAFLKYFNLEQADVDSVLDAVPRALDGRELTREELAREILRITKRPHLEEHLLSGWGVMLKPAAFRGLLCFGPQSGRVVTFVRPDQWLGRWEEHDELAAQQEVFRRFLSAYAPASRAEVARWWGVRPPQAGRVLGAMGDELTEVEVGGVARYVLARDVASLRRAGNVEGVRLLPSFDQILVMSAPHSEAIVDPEFKPRILKERIAVWSLPAVLVDGRAAAVWKLDRKARRAVVRVEPFRRLSRAARAGIDAEAATLGTTLEVPVEVVITSDTR